MRKEKLDLLKRTIRTGLFPTEHKLFQGAGLIVSPIRNPNYDDEGKFLIITQHASPISWLVFQLKGIYKSQLNASNKYDFYPLIGEVLSGQMNEDGDIIQAMLNAVNEIEKRMNKI